MSLGLDKLTAEDRVVLAQSSGMMSIFEDPISFEIMDKAMMTTCGHSFSEDTINNWILKKNQCPLCNKTLKKSDVSPNYALRNAIARFLTAQAHLQQNIQNSLGNVSVSSEWTTPASPIADDWKTEDGGSPNLDFKLLVEVISARDLKTDWFGKTNPYCVLEFQDQRRKTTVVHRNRCPAWGEVFVFNVTNIHADSNVLISVWDKDRILKDSFIGMITVSMAEVITTLKMVRRFVLQKRRPSSRKKICGDILLRLQFLDLRANYEIGRSSQSLSPMSSRVSTTPSISRSTPMTISPPSHHSLPSPHQPLPSPIPFAPSSPAHQSLPAPVAPLPSILKRSPIPARRSGYPASPAPASPRSPRREPRDSLGLNRYGIRPSASDIASGSGSGGGPSNAAQARSAVASASGGASASGSGYRMRAESEANDSDVDSDIVVAGSAASGSAGGSVIVNASESAAVHDEDDHVDPDDDENEDDHENEANDVENEDDEREEEREEEDEDNNGNINNNDNDNDDDAEDNGNNHLENNNNNNFNEDINNNNDNNENGDNNQEHDNGENYENPENYENNGNFERFENYEKVDLDIDIRVDDLNNDRDSSSSNPSSSSPHPSSSSHAPSSSYTQTTSSSSPPSHTSEAYFSEDWSLPPPPPPPLDLSRDSPVPIPNSPVKSAKDSPVVRSTPYFFSTEAPRYPPGPSPSPPPPLPPRTLTFTHSNTSFTQFISSDEHYSTVPSPLAPSPSPSPISPKMPVIESSPRSPPPRRLDNDFAFTSVGLSPSSRKQEKSPQQAALPVFPPLDILQSLDIEAFFSNQSSSDGKVKRDSAEIAQQMYEELHALQFQLQQKESSPASPRSVPLEDLEDDEDEPEEELTRERHRRNNKSTPKTVSPSLRLPPSPLSLPLPSLSSPLPHLHVLPPSPPVASSPARAANAVPAKFNTAPHSAQPPPASPSARAANHARRNSSHTHHTPHASPQASPRTSSAQSSAHSSAHSTPNHSRNNSITNASIKNNKGNSTGRAQAAALVLDPQDPAPESPLQLHAARNSAVEPRVVANEESVNSLMEMGFERDLAEYALKSCNNEMEPALDKLLNNSGQLQFELLRSLLFT